MDVKFRTLKAEEIEVRPAQIKDGKATILLYIDSRAVVRIMNETVGPMNWNMEFTEVNGQVVGKMGIWDEEKSMWVYKSDTGSESNIEAQKGLFSDCYKRTLARWGVDELYSAPRIIIDDDGYGCRGYKVSRIEYNEDRNIVFLAISNRYGKTVFTWSVTDGDAAPAPTPTISPYDALKSYCGQLKATADKEQLKKFWAYYEPKSKEWRGNFNPEQLWKKWTAS